MILKPDFVWKKTKLSDFCFKCIANNHEQCTGKCECLCKGLEVDQDGVKNRAYRDKMTDDRCIICGDLEDLNEDNKCDYCHAEKL